MRDRLAPAAADVSTGAKRSREVRGAQMAGYSGTPLPRKLGIKEESLVLVVGAPDGFDLGPLPAGVRPHRRAAAAAYDVQLVFCGDVAALRRRFGPAKERLARDGRLWIAWPKRSSGVRTDLDEN